MKNSTLIVTALCVTIVSCVTISSLKEIYVGSLTKQAVVASCEACTCKVATQKSTH